MTRPDPRVIIDPRFRELTLGHVPLEVISTGHRWTEGPVWFADLGVLVFSDIPNNRICRWCEGGGTSVLDANSCFSNGSTRDRLGRLVTCEHGSRRVVRREYDGSRTVLADAFEGKPLNSPNDVVVKSDGTIWFTDPSYGIMSDYEGCKSDQEQAGHFVFCLDETAGSLSAIITDFDQPNGLCFSNDEKILYVAESGKSHNDDVPSVIRAFDVASDNTLSPRGDFASIEPGVPDGMRVDVEGNLWTSAADGVHCYAPDGTLLGKISVPETVANLTFGGPRGNQLFITATTSVYSIFLNSSAVSSGG